MVKTQFPMGGFTVHEGNSKSGTPNTRLQKRWKDGTRQNAVLPIKWEAPNSMEILEAIKAVHEHMSSRSGMTLQEAVRLLTAVETPIGVDIKTSWDDVAARYRSHLVDSGMVKAEVYDVQHVYAVRRVLEAVTGTAAPTTAKGVLQKIATGKPGTRGRVVRVERAAAFFRFAVKEVGMDARWWPPEGEELVTIKGKRPPNDTKTNREGKAAYLLDEPFLRLYDSIRDPRWKMAFGLLGVFGLRGVELKYLEVRGTQLYCSYRKRSGRGEPTPPRYIEPLDPKSRPGLGQQLLLQLSTNITGLPPLGTKDGETSDKLLKHLKRNAVWQQLQSEAQGQTDERMSIYSFRHGYAYRSSMVYNLPIRVAAKLMGHSVDTHMRDYGERLYGDDLRDAVEAARIRLKAEVG